jgi:hypothetical protein
VEDRAMTRVRRMAGSFAAGGAMLEFCVGDGRPLLTDAAARGIPPVTAISRPLIDLVGSAALEPAGAKQFVGLVTRAVLAQEGYVPVRSGVRLRNDPAFTAGTIYAKRFPTKRKRQDELLKRILDSFTADEIHEAFAYLRERLEKGPNS